ncbi:hypothetical protein HK102_013473 [Quaeritorhiza haematococci]|nr:hypothetical protein HK102_013473 [Quaeritorhiza haematococci]
MLRRSLPGLSVAVSSTQHTPGSCCLAQRTIATFSSLSILRINRFGTQCLPHQGCPLLQHLPSLSSKRTSVTTTTPTASPKTIVDGIPQRTPEWFQRRKDLVTASEAAALLPADPDALKPYIDEYHIPEYVYHLQDLNGIYGDDDSTEGSTVLNSTSVKLPPTLSLPSTTSSEYKLALHPYMTDLDVRADKLSKVNETRRSSAMSWGNRFEPIALHYCSHPSGLDMGQIQEYGLLVHPTDKWLGCSVDGVSPSRNTVVEVKCPRRPRFTFKPKDRNPYLDGPPSLSASTRMMMEQGIGPDPAFYADGGTDDFSSMMGDPTLTGSMDYLKYSGMELPPKAPVVYWWIQVQLQLEVLGLEEGLITQVSKFLSYASKGMRDQEMRAGRK